MVLEEQVVFLGGASDAAEDVAAHESVDVRAEAVDDLCVPLY